MKVDFNNIEESIVALSESKLQWLFVGENIQQEHLDQIKPLDSKGAKFLWDYISDCDLHNDIPFRKGFFRTIDKALVTNDNQSVIKKWLYQRGLPFDKQVYLSWQPNEALILPWKLLVKYYEVFAHPGADLTVIDESLTWALLFYHENEIYFGTNNDYEPSKTFEDIDFIW